VRSGSSIADGQFNEDRVMHRIAIAAAGTALTLVAGLASASEVPAGAVARADRCAPVPSEQFRSEADLAEVVERFGYRVVRVDTERGCYAVVAVDRQGKRYDIRFQGASLRMVSRYAAKPEAEVVATR
jgi:Peptidase propeptide and YPEB domain